MNNINSSLQEYIITTGCLAEKRTTILKLRKIFKMGYVPRRDTEDYLHKMRDGLSCELVNCFAHSCFNLTDNLLEKFCFCRDDMIAFSKFPKVERSSLELVDGVMESFLRESGLEVQPCSYSTKVDARFEWKVVVYYNTEEHDFHYMLQEPNGAWSSKMGLKPEVYLIDRPRQQFCIFYDLYGYKKITNPYKRAYLEKGLQK